MNENLSRIAVLCSDAANWVPACGGTEKPFETRTGHRVQYMWCPRTGEHAYLDLSTDIFIPNDSESMRAFGLIW